MRQLTWGHTPPQDACQTFRVMLEELRQLEADMHQHVHKENNLLFPRAIDLEQAIFFPPVPQL
jgi:regulator of cell morphogenesis and NO signaling